MLVKSASPWRCRDRVLETGARTLVMGIINVTPDSFSDGGRFLAPDAAVAHARRLREEGADILDLGAESTRPGSAPVPAEEQIRRLEPVLGALAGDAGWVISVDTTSAAVAARVLELGARIVNDVSALGDPAMAEVVRASGAGLVLMHARGTPATMQNDPRYDDAAREVSVWLGGRLGAARASGIAPEQVALDPGIGFGKTVAHNLELIARLDEIAAHGRPVLVGLSRKRFLGALTEREADGRLEAGLAATAAAVMAGAAIVRTHDVAATIPALRIAEALRAARR